jgi:hypothetical protein
LGIETHAVHVDAAVAQKHAVVHFTVDARWLDQTKGMRALHNQLSTLVDGSRL